MVKDFRLYVDNSENQCNSLCNIDFYLLNIIFHHEIGNKLLNRISTVNYRVLVDIY